MIEFGREVCGDPVQSSSREWLVTNGIGGYASGTVSGEITRRHHGLLVAALRPPVGRTLLVTKLDETIDYDGATYPLSTNRWDPGDVHPHGYLQIERFRLDGLMPVWSFACADALIEKRIWMEHLHNIVYVRYRVMRARRPVTLVVEPLVNYRANQDIMTSADWAMDTRVEGRGITLDADGASTQFHMSMGGADYDPVHEWRSNYFLWVDEGRGTHPHESHLQAGRFTVTLDAGQETTFVATSEDLPQTVETALGRAVERERELLARSGLHDAPDGIRQLVLAADQFIVRRRVNRDPDGRSVIAGYPWFEDWGRDTMIALPGLTLVTGRPDIARKILLTFAGAESKGMLPNRFPEDGSAPVYNTIDATPWFFEAVRAYYTSTTDRELLEIVFPMLNTMVRWHEQGTRYGIRFDPDDGLVTGGPEGAPLTWMDARMGDFVPTPRVGKPVEISALWYNALCVMADFARLLGKSPAQYEALAGRMREGFKRFWNDNLSYCFDVVDGPDGADPSLRPNQIFAASLPYSPLETWQQQAVVDACARSLLTSHGLRSLAPFDEKYLGRYAGGLRERDAAYHQGTVWSWLIGPFVSAHYRVHGDRDESRSFLEPLFLHLSNDGIGTVSEIFDAEPPFEGRGCIAQAWGVAEVLRAWHETR